MTEWKCGRYTVREAMRVDNPRWPQYQVFRAGALVGLSFSVPDEGWCKAIERVANPSQSVALSAKLTRFKHRLRGATAKNHRKASG